LATTGEERTARSWTLERWLRYWLSSRTSIRPTTRLHYTRDVEQFLIPYLGKLCLADLDTRRLRAAFALIAKTTNRRGQPQSPSCLRHLRTTLRAALSLAVREGVIADNPARHLEIPYYRKPHPQVWTDGRVDEWRRTRIRPAVAVWTGAPTPVRPATATNPQANALTLDQKSRTATTPGRHHRDPYRPHGTR
jgi:hypothetical protein